MNNKDDSVPPSLACPFTNADEVINAVKMYAFNDGYVLKQTRRGKYRLLFLCSVKECSVRIRFTCSTKDNRYARIHT